MKLLKILFLMILVCSAQYPTARADIVWSGVQNLHVDESNIWTPEFTNVVWNLDIDGNGIVDYEVGETRFSTFSVRSGTNETTASWIGSHGAMIDDSRTFEPDGALLSYWTEVYTHYGPWSGESGYMGLRFASTNSTHYGWLHMSVYDDGSGMDIHSWAYNTVPDEGIVAGAIPEPSSVVLLLVGGTGIWMARKRRTRPDNTPARQKALDRYE